MLKRDLVAMDTKGFDCDFNINKNKPSKQLQRQPFAELDIHSDETSSQQSQLIINKPSKELQRQAFEELDIHSDETDLQLYS